MTASSLLNPSGQPKPTTLGQWKRIPDYDASSTSLSVKNEIRRNLLRRIERNENLFPGVHGYEDSVFRKSSTRCFLVIILYFWGCGDRRRAAFFAD
jgi:hypothetical protein